MNPDGNLITVKSLRTYFPVTGGLFSRVVGHVRAVDNVTFHIKEGETLGLVGESGCGKTTVGRSLLRLVEPTSGEIQFRGESVVGARGKKLQKMRRQMQIIFQDPYSSLNPRKTIADIVGESLLYHRVVKSPAERDEAVKQLLVKVGLSPNYINRYPHEFSGGQRQRIGVARAIALNPAFIVCDEAVSALDVSIRAQVINLLMRLREELKLSYLFISHDLSVVRHISHRVAVMYLGRLVEEASCQEIFRNPCHPYTKALLSAVPVPDPKKHIQRVILKGDVPSPLKPPAGCYFHTRCPHVMPRCKTMEPDYYYVNAEHRVKCFLYDTEHKQKTIAEQDQKAAVVMGKKIRQLREMKGISQIELAEKIENLQMNVANWESGATIPNAFELLRLLKFLDISFESFYEAVLSKTSYDEKLLEEVRSLKEKVLLLSRQVGLE